MGPVILLILLAVLIGSLSQRVTGMGFAMVSAPFLVLLMDPIAGVVLVNLCGIVSSVLVLSRTHREVDWSRAWRLIVTAIVGTVPGALLAVALPGHALEILIGALVVVSLTTSMILTRYARPVRLGMPALAVSGLTAGAMSSAAGVGGPALSALALLTRWEQRSFAATIQPVFVAVSSSAVIMKLVFDHDAWPGLAWTTWVLIFVALGAGQLLGEWLSRIVPVSGARAGMLILAFLGGFLTIARGLGLM